MNSINNLNNYLKNQHISVTDDAITKGLIKSHFEDLELKQKWGSMLDDEFNLKSLKTAPIVPQNKNRNLFLVLISVILLALIIFFSLSVQDKSKNESKLQALLNDHYSNPVPRELLKGPTETMHVAQNAYGLYQSQKYEEAIPIFEELIVIEPLNEEHHFYLGLSYLYNEQPRKAVQEFDWMLNAEKSNRMDMAMWFKALALTEAKEYKEAKIHLQDIATWNTNKGKSILAEKASQLLILIQEEQNK